jgi:hypothetical protein
MNILFLFLFSSIFYIRSLKNVMFQKTNIKQKLYENYSSSSGVDERYSQDGDLNKTQVNIFSEKLKKMYLLQILHDESVSVITKINLIKNISNNNNNNYETNLGAAGLFDHFHLFMLD